MIRITTAAASYVGTCDHCCESRETVRFPSAETITVLSLQREGVVVFMARFCQRHFLRFSDLVSDQVAALLSKSEVGVAATGRQRRLVSAPAARDNSTPSL